MCALSLELNSRGHTALLRLLGDPEPRRVAEELDRRLRSVDGLAAAIDIVEAALLIGERVHNRRTG
jgi:hypothetical protein